MLLLLLESKTECPRHAESAVVGRAAAQANNDLLRISLGGIQNHLPNPESARKIDIVLIRPQSPHTGRFTHFHHSELLILDPAVTRFDFAAEWIVRFTFQPHSAERLRDDFRSAFAAIGHRRNVDPGTR